MPSWRKVILSGSDASLANLTATTVSASFSGSFQGNGSGLTNVPSASYALTSSLLTGRFLNDSSASINQSYNGITTILRANEIHTFSDFVFVNSTGSAQIGDSDSINTATTIAMCVTPTASAGSNGEYLLMGTARNDNWNWTPGGILFLSVSGSNGRTITQLNNNQTGSNQITQVIGMALAAKHIFVNPQLVQVITQ